MWDLKKSFNSNSYDSPSLPQGWWLKWIMIFMQNPVLQKQPFCLLQSTPCSRNVQHSPKKWYDDYWEQEKSNAVLRNNKFEVNTCKFLRILATFPNLERRSLTQGLKGITKFCLITSVASSQYIEVRSGRKRPEGWIRTIRGNIGWVASSPVYLYLLPQGRNSKP